MADLTRRDALKMAAAGAAAACTDPLTADAAGVDPAEHVGQVLPLGFPWHTRDPFLFCVHHDDSYPAGDARMGPAASLAGRNLGQDFAGVDGWRMYHGTTVPGFPQHPHRGFETVTVVRRGLVDHSDSLGATARYGRGDVQWLTAGRGILHAEMFPLVRPDGPNPLELFQIWLNLPQTHKMVAPSFTMFWGHDIPQKRTRDPSDGDAQVTVIAGQYGDLRALSPPPDSWASQEGSDVAIWTIGMGPGTRWKLPAARPGTHRTLYFFSGSGLRIGSRTIQPSHLVELRGDVEIPLTSGPGPIEMLLLQGRPIGEPVAHYGPFVMNTQEEIRRAMLDYRQTQFGGWPWGSDDPVHEASAGRFARHADGRVERPA